MASQLRATCRRAEDIFDIDFFGDEPRPFFHLAKELYPGTFRPTLGHYFLRLLQDNGALHRLYTQNIDTLERQAGLTPEKLIEAHGSFASATCRSCGRQYEQAWMAAKIFGAEGVPCAAGDVKPAAPAAAAAAASSSSPVPVPSTPVELDKVVIPRCDSCSGVVKPDITFFGEDLPERFAECVGPDCKAADAVIVIGTSLKVSRLAPHARVHLSIALLVSMNCVSVAPRPSNACTPHRRLTTAMFGNIMQVMPVSGIPGRVGHLVPRLLINRDAVNTCDPEDDTDGQPAPVGGEVTAEEALRRAYSGGVNTRFRFSLKDNYRDVFFEVR